MGHNLGLFHSWLGGNQYGDHGCIMGGGPAPTCFNAPQSHALGWATPIATLDGSSLLAGVWWQVALPATMLTSNSFLLLRPTWLPNGPLRNAYLYLSYRLPLALDSGLRDDYGRRVHVSRGARAAPLLHPPPRTAGRRACACALLLLVMTGRVGQDAAQ